MGRAYRKHTVPERSQTLVLFFVCTNSTPSGISDDAIPHTIHKSVLNYSPGSSAIPATAMTPHRHGGNNDASPYCLSTIPGCSLYEPPRSALGGRGPASQTRRLAHPLPTSSASHTRHTQNRRRGINSLAFHTRARANPYFVKSFRTGPTQKLRH